MQKSLLLNQSRIYHAKKNKSFDDWRTQEIRLTFNIEQVPAN